MLYPNVVANRDPLGDSFARDHSAAADQDQRSDGRKRENVQPGWAAWVTGHSGEN